MNHLFLLASRMIRPVWPFIPRSIRLLALRGVTRNQTLLDRLDRSLKPPGPNTPRIIVGMFSSHYSFGKVARLFESAVSESGAPTYHIDIAPIFPDQATGRAFKLKFPPQEVLDQPHHLILVANGFLTAFILTGLGNSFTRFAFVSSFWAWESPVLPAAWGPGFGLSHEIIVPSHFTKEAVTRANADAIVRIAPHSVVGSHLPETDPESMLRDPLVVVHFSNLASDVLRKNPLGALALFCEAFEPRTGPTFRVHLNNPHTDREVVACFERIAKERSDIKLTTGVMSDAELADWWRGAHIFLSAHRAEGFGLGLAEAMSAGICAAGTGWSGNMDFMTEDNAICLPFSLKPRSYFQRREREEVPYSVDDRWADISIGQSAKLLQQANEDRVTLLQKAMRGKREIAVRTHADFTKHALHLMTPNGR